MENLSKFISRQAALLKEGGIDQAKAEVELILCHLLEVDRLKLYLDGGRLLTPEVQKDFDVILNKRLKRFPLQYILNEAWFYGRKFYVNKSVMVPTPETELLCLLTFNFIKETNLEHPRILDVGTGSGVIAVTLANELDRPEIVAVDISEAALEIARRNAETLGGADRINFRRSDFFEGVSENEKFDLILSNPPYITEEDYKTLPPEVLADPKIALVAGEKGLDAIEIILKHAPYYLSEGGRIMFEIGYNQSEWVTALTEKDARYDSINIVRDLNDIDRVVVLTCGY